MIMFSCERTEPCTREGIYEFDVMVLSGGKTGSTTLQYSFGERSLHAHNKEFWVNYLKMKGTNKCFGCTCRYNIERLLEQGKELFIFSSFRDPVARSLSSFFQNPSANGRAAGLLRDKYTKGPLTAYECKEISDYAIKHLENYDPIADMELINKGNREILRLHKGTQVIMNPIEGLRIVILDFQNIAKWPKIIPAIGTHFPKGAWDFTYQPLNLTSEKAYYAQYKQFKAYCKNRFTLKELAMKMRRYSSIVDIFWSKDRKKEFMSQWCIRSDIPFSALYAQEDLRDFFKFDHLYYAETYPDVVEARGSSEMVLWDHFIGWGINEGRSPNANGPVKNIPSEISEKLKAWPSARINTSKAIIQ